MTGIQGLVAMQVRAWYDVEMTPNLNVSFNQEGFNTLYVLAATPETQIHTQNIKRVNF